MSGSVDLIAAKQDLLKRLTFVFHKTPTHVAIFCASTCRNLKHKSLQQVFKKTTTNYVSDKVQMIWWSLLRGYGSIDPSLLT